MPYNHIFLFKSHLPTIYSQVQFSALLAVNTAYAKRQKTKTSQNLLYPPSFQLFFPYQIGIFTAYEKSVSDNYFQTRISNHDKPQKTSKNIAIRF